MFIVDWVKTVAFQVSETLMKCAKKVHFLNYCSYKMIKFLIQNIWPVKYTDF